MASTRAVPRKETRRQLDRLVQRYLQHLNLAVEHSVLDAEDREMARQGARQALGLSRRQAEAPSGAVNQR